MKYPALKPISEAQWQEQVILMARTFGWKAAHFRPALNKRGKWQTAVAADGAGFPDLVLVHRFTSDVIFVELKRDDGKTSPEQDAWLTWLGSRGVVWRPRDFDAVRARLMVHHLGPRRGDDAPPTSGATA